jgi:hypothetical protein
VKTPHAIFRLSPEIRILLDACQIAVGVTDGHGCDAPPGPVDGDRLLSLGEEHKLLPVLYQAMAGWDWKGVSEETRHQLIRLYSANVIRSQKAIKCLQRIVDVLDQNKIEYMAFKGPELSETVYGDPHLRSFLDIDLLVPRQKAIDAVNGLIAAGFEPGIILSQERLPTYVRWEHFLPLVDHVTGTHVELHWEFTGYYAAKPVEMPSIMTERASLLGQEVCVPRAEIYLVYLCLHGAHKTASFHRTAVRS